MSWRDSQRLTGRARTVRRSGWVTFGVLVMLVAADAAAESSGSGLTLITVVGVLGGAVLGLSHLIAYFMDRRAERVVTR